MNTIEYHLLTYLTLLIFISSAILKAHAAESSTNESTLSKPSAALLNTIKAHYAIEYEKSERYLKKPESKPFDSKFPTVENFIESIMDTTKNTPTPPVLNKKNFNL